MNPKKQRHITARLVAGFLLLATLFASAVTPASAGPAAPDRDWQKYEQRIMKVIMNHHLYELEIARLCLTQATHAELIDLCQSLVSTLPTEISTLQSWLQSWYGESYRPRLNPAQKATLKHLALSRLKGAKFEIQSMKIYRLLFRQGAADERVCARRAPHPGLATYCGQDIVTMNQNFRSVTQWLCNWWERCYGGTKPSLLWEEW